MAKRIVVPSGTRMQSPILIGVLSPMLASSFFSEVLIGVVDEASYYGGSVIGIQTHDLMGTDPNDPYFAINDHIASDEFAGLISFVDAVPDELLYTYNKELHKPVVLVSHKVKNFECPSVSPNNKLGVEQLIAHLVSHGHSRIGFVGCNMQNDIKERFVAYKSSMVKHGLSVEDAMIIEVDNLIESAGKQAAEVIMENGFSTTALVCATDFIAIGLMKELGKHGYEFPKDQAIVAFDDTEQGSLMLPPLTTIRQNFVELGVRATQLLMEKISGRYIEDKEYMINTSLVIRSSCGCEESTDKADTLRGQKISADPYADFANSIGEIIRIHGRNERKITEIAEATALAIADALVCSEDEFQNSKKSLLAKADALWKVSPRYEVVCSIQNAVLRYSDSIGTSVQEKCDYRLRSDQIMQIFTDSYVRLQDLSRTDLYDVLRREYDMTLSLLKSPIDGIVHLPFLKNSKTKAGILGIWDYLHEDSTFNATSAVESNIIPINSGSRHRPISSDADSVSDEFHTIASDKDKYLVVEDYYPNSFEENVVNKTISASHFPPKEITSLANAANREVTIVLPIKTKDTYWGLLALVGEIDLTIVTGRDFYFQASTLISVALEQRRLMESIIKSKHELKSSKEMYQIISQTTSDAIFDYNFDSGYVYFSERWKEVFGLSNIGNDINEWLQKIHLDDYLAMESGLERCRNGESDLLESIHRIRYIDDSYKWLHARGAVVTDQGTSQRRLVGSITDITDRRNLEDQLRHQALHDDLTGLPNRALIIDRTEQMIAIAKRNHRTVSILFVDLDNFKEVNDAYGHSVGDELLVAVAARLRRAARETDTVGRLAGDEFAILVDNGDSIGVPELLAERVQDILKAPFHISERDYLVSASIGIATSADKSAESLLQDADVAMYQAKTKGKNQYVVFKPRMQQDAHKRLEVELDLTAALAEHQLRVYYQPIFKLAKREMVGMEALVRWQHPTKGLLQPVDFIPIAEESGRLIIDIGRYVLAEACSTTAEWNRSGANLDIAVNLSAKQLESDEIIMTVSEVLSSTGLDPKHLVLEVTETSMMHDAEAVVVRMSKLKSLGVRLAIDDFGTGYSSLAYLRRFPVDVLKIDRSFVISIAESAEDVSVVQTLVALGRTLDLEVVAEGVEFESQLNVVEEVGCSGVQGFLLGRPLDHASTEMLIGNDLAIRQVRN